MTETHTIEAILTARDQGFIAGMEAAQKSANSLGGTIKSGLGFGFLAGIGSKAVGLLTKGLDKIASHTDAAISRVDTLNQFPKMMKQMGFSAKDSEASIQKLGDSINGLPTTLDEVAKSTQSLALLTGDLKGATKLSIALNDAFLGSGASADEASRGLTQYSQMLSKGKVDQQSWNTLLDTMPVALTKVANAFGFTGASAKTDLYDALKSGAITFDQFNEKFIELDGRSEKTGEAISGFSKLAEESTKGIATSMQNVGSAITKGLANTITAIDNLIKKTTGLDGIAGIFDEIKKQVNNVFGAFNGQLEGLESIGDVIDFVTSKFGGLFAVVGGGAAAAKMFQIFSIGEKQLNKFSGKLGTAKTMAKGSFEKMKTMADKTGSAMQKIVPKGITEKIQKMTGTATEKLSGMTGKIGKVGGKITSVFGKFGGKMAGGLGKMMSLAMKSLMPAAVVATALAGLGLLYQQFGGQIDQILALAQTKGPEIIQNLASGITSALPGLIASGAQMAAGLLDTLAANLPAIITAGTDIIIALVSGLGSAMPTLVPSAINAIGTFARSVLTNLPRLVAAGMQLLASLAQGIGSNLPMIVQGAMSAIGEFAQSIAANLPSILTAGVSIIASLLGGILRSIPTLIGSIPTLFGNVVSAIKSVDWIGLGGDIIEAIAEGLLGAAGKIGGKIIGAFSGAKTQGKQSGKDVSKSAAEGVKAGEADVSKAATDLTNKLGVDLSGGIENISGSTNSSMADLSASLANTLASGDTSQARTKGQETGAAYVEGMKTGIAQLPAVAQTAIEGFITTLSGSVARFVSIGAQAAAGFKASFSTGIATSLAPIGVIIRMGAALRGAGAAAVRVSSALGARFAAGVVSGMARATSATTSGVKRIVLTMRKGAPAAIVSGKATGTGYITGLRLSIGKAGSTATLLTKTTAAKLRAGRPAAVSAGRMIGAGFATGMRSTLAQVRSAANAMAAAADKAVRAKAKIKSPSRVFMSLGNYVGEGFAMGIDDMHKRITKAAQDMVYVPNEYIPALAGNFSGELSEDYDYYRTADYTISVPVQVDGRTVAKATAKYTEDELNKMNTRNNRKNGIR
ncbi:MAG: tape measure protein [Eubacterium sp.]|nr:tape measure protein [Eubacterium sp.]